jgi:hypothetical protein
VCKAAQAHKLVEEFAGKPTQNRRAWLYILYRGKIHMSGNATTQELTY